MGQYVYWHAPLWEVLLVALATLALGGWLVARALRRPDLSAALLAVNPALGDQPIFFFNRVSGVICLNDGARRMLKALPEARQPFLREALADTLLDAYEEAHPTQQEDWPEPNYTLVALPVSGPAGGIVGVMALVIAQSPLPPAGRIRDPHLSEEAKAWLELGPTLRLHCTRPVVHVKRPGEPEPAEQAPGEVAGSNDGAWQEYPLGHMEDTLLRYLLDHQAEVQPAEVLFRIVWPDDMVDNYGLRPEQKDRLRRLVHQLRQHIEPDPRNPRYLRIAYGIGYVLYSEGEPAGQ